MKKIFIISLFFILVLTVNVYAIVPPGASYHSTLYTDLIMGAGVDNKVVVGAGIFQIGPYCNSKLQLGDDSWIYDDDCEASSGTTLHIDSDDQIQIKSQDNLGINVNTFGNVGIKKSNPAYALDVKGTIQASEKIITPSIMGAGADNKVVVDADIFQISSDCTGKLQLGDDSWIYDDSCPGGSSIPEQRTLYIESADDIHIRNTNAYVDGIYIATDGKVGVGTTTPVNTLDVNGTISTYQICDENNLHCTDLSKKSIIQGVQSSMFGTPDLLEYKYLKIWSPNDGEYYYLPLYSVGELSPFNLYMDIDCSPVPLGAPGCDPDYDPYCGDWGEECEVNAILSGGSGDYLYCVTSAALPAGEDEPADCIPSNTVSGNSFYVGIITHGVPGTDYIFMAKATDVNTGETDEGFAVSS